MDTVNDRYNLIGGQFLAAKAAGVPSENADSVDHHFLAMTCEILLRVAVRFIKKESMCGSAGVCRAPGSGEIQAVRVCPSD
jgi:hypothetical protein